MGTLPLVRPYLYQSKFSHLPMGTLPLVRPCDNSDLSNDISENPGPQHSNHFDQVSPYFSFCNWNLNTLSNDEFSRVSLLNAHNSIHNYDIISVSLSISD